MAQTEALTGAQFQAALYRRYACERTDAQQDMDKVRDALLAQHPDHRQAYALGYLQSEIESKQASVESIRRVYAACQQGMGPR